MWSSLSVICDRSARACTFSMRWLRWDTLWRRKPSYGNNPHLLFKHDNCEVAGALIVHFLPFRMCIWEDWDPIYWFNHATFLCLFQIGIWISNIIYCYPPFLCSVSYWRGECSFYRHLWNCWPLLFKLFFIVCRKFF
jgi:hypothetical protein